MNRKSPSLLLLLFCITATVFGQVQIMPAEKLASLRQSLPGTEKDVWQEFFDDPTTLYYTSTEMPVAYQHAMGGLVVSGSFMGRGGSAMQSTFHWALNNISGDANERQKPDGEGGNANVEFPWRHNVAGGTDESRGIAITFKMMRLPKKDSGSPWPVAWYSDVLGGSDQGPQSVLNWIFPKGTTFAEVLVMKDSKATLHTWEVRLRIRESNYWDVDVLKPFPTSSELAAALKREGYQSEQVMRPRVIQMARLFDGLHRKPAFNVLAGVDELPTLGEDLAAKLLDSTPFKSAVGAVWHAGTNGVDALSPTTNERFSIVPPGFHGTFIGNDTESCKNCHRHTLKHVDEFDSVRQWYGRVRGGDQIFSWNPVEPSSVADNGASIRVVLRRAFVEAGMLEQYDKAKHPTDMYSLLEK